MHSVKDEVWVGAFDQVRDPIWSEGWWQVRWQVLDRVMGQVGGRVVDQVGDPVWVEVKRRFQNDGFKDAVRGLTGNRSRWW